MLQTALVALASFVAAAVNAVAGGGTFITFPALTGFLGLSLKAANMTSTIGLWPGSASSIYPALPDVRTIPRGIIVTYSVISLVGGVAGALLLKHTSSASFDLIIPWLLLIGTVIFGFSKPIARWAGRGMGKAHQHAGWTFAVACIQLLVAVYGGYFGAGVGVLTLAGLAFVGLESIAQMNALKVVVVTLINLVASLVFLFDPEVNWRVALVMAVASIAGGFLGMAVARKLPHTALRAFILLVAGCLTVVYFVKAYR